MKIVITEELVKKVLEEMYKKAVPQIKDAVEKQIVKSRKELRKEKNVVSNCIAVYYDSYEPRIYERTGLLKNAYTKGYKDDFEIRETSAGLAYKTGYSLSDLSAGVMAGYRPMGRGKPWEEWGNGYLITVLGKTFNLGSTHPNELLEYYRSNRDTYYRKLLRRDFDLSKAIQF